MTSIKNFYYIVASIFLAGFIIYLTKPIFNPLLAGFIIALALKPLASQLEKIKIPRMLSTISLILLLILFVVSLCFIFSIQISNLNFEMEHIQKNIDGFYKFRDKIGNVIGLSPNEQSELLAKSYSNVIQSSASIFKNTLSLTTDFLTAFALFIVSLFFFLYYRSFFISFLYKAVDTRFHKRLSKIITKIQSVVYHYIVGLSLVILAVAVLNSLGLLFLGIDNAVFFGMFAAVLTLIPYIGIVIGALLPIVFVFITTGSLLYCLGVLAVFLIVQGLEGNVLTPNIVGRQVQVNAFAAILSLVLGGMFLGINGIIFALPLLAIGKVIMDEIPMLKPYGFLIEIPKS